MFLLVEWLKKITENKNPACNDFNTDHILWWRLILEEYVQDIEYISWETNMAADALSQLPNMLIQMDKHESTYTT